MTKVNQEYLDELERRISFMETQIEQIKEILAAATVNMKMVTNILEKLTGVQFK